MVLLAALMAALSFVVDAASHAWRDSQSRTDSFQSARTALEIMSRELAPAVVNTQMQFVVAPGTVLTNAGALNVVPSAPAVLWMAPLGSEGQLCCVGYYLYSDPTHTFYRLKRIFVAPSTSIGAVSPYFPRMTNPTSPRNAALEPSPDNANWFTNNWTKETFDEEDPTDTTTVVSTAADGVIAFWVQCLDLLGNPIPAPPAPTTAAGVQLIYNSATYFEMATTTPFDTGLGFVYLSRSPQALKGNRTPAAINLTVVVLDALSLARNPTVPPQGASVDGGGPLDLQAYQTALQANKIYNAKAFTTRVRFFNGS